MEKEELLLKMMETVGRGRRGHKHHRDRKKHPHDPNTPEKEKKLSNKLSPVAENALFLLYREGSMNQRTLAHRLNVTVQAVSELMKKFEEKEYIIRESGSLNNENIVSLTERGQEKGKECVEKLSKLANKLFRNFSEEDLLTLSKLLIKMEYEEELP